MSEKKKKLIGKNVGVAADKFNVVNFDGEITKPASVLLEKLSAGISEVYAPIGKVRHAKADAKVARIEAEKYELQKRAAHRVMGEYVREQENIDAVTVKTLERLSPDTTEETVRGMDEDKVVFMRNLFKMASDEKMQDLWASVLAGEAEHPGSFSKSTVALVGMMDQNDARMFADFCQFMWSLFIWETDGEREESVLLIYDWQKTAVDNRFSSYSLLRAARHLDYLRLISYDGAGYTKMFSSPLFCYKWGYHGAHVHIYIPQSRIGNEDRYVMDVGHAMFTEAGEQLYRICGAQKNDDAFQYVLGKWAEKGYNPCTVLPDADKKGAGE